MSLNLKRNTEQGCMLDSDITLGLHTAVRQVGH